MASIRVLSESVVNRIAAGEVVERPASVVKELVENSLDAQADRVEVVLEDGGCTLIRVSDNGCGMAPDDARLAWESHATSKLSDADDLWRIRTLGFRGEALPSIAAVSQALMITRPRGGAEGGALEGTRIVLAGGAIREVSAVGAPEGTTVEVRNLFYNVPARKKFLRTPATEQSHAVEAFTRLALPHAAVTFHLTADGRPLLRLPGPVALKERIRAIVGGAVADRLVEIGAESDALRVSGYAAPPDVHRASAQMVYTFLNGRYIRDRGLLGAVMQAYRGLVPAGRFPAVFLMLEIEPERVDVNVHPSKVEVRFREPQAVYAQVVRALQAARGGAVRILGAGQGDVPPASSTAPEREAAIRRAISDFFDRHAAPAPAAQGRLWTLPAAPQPRPSVAAPEPQTEETRRAPPPSLPGDVPSEGRMPAPAPASPRRRCAQFCDAYIVEETEDGIAVSDQHALHERILYETLTRRSSGAAQGQRLLVPFIVELKPRDLTLILSLKGALAGAGVEVEEFGAGAVAVHALPASFDRVDPRDLLSDLLDASREEAEGLTQAERVRRALACKGAVKAGQRLSPEEIESLLRQRDTLGVAPYCPHGRPTTFCLSRAELEKRFRRT